MKTIYAHLRITDLALKRKVKARAALEGLNEIELVEQALKDYLKKPLAK